MSKHISIFDFGKGLIETGDLDPVYTLLLNSNFKKSSLKRFLVAYLCFYNVGTACYVIEGGTSKDFYKRLEYAFENNFPRNAERRHFRGDAGRTSIKEFKKKFKHPEDAISKLETCRTFGEVEKIVREYAGFGKWAVFKLADLLERVMGYDIDFSDCRLSIYSEPVKAARMTFPSYTLDKAVEILEAYFSRFDAPPKNDRKINVQEVETILCKYKSYLNNSYHIGKDIEELKKTLFEKKIVDNVYLRKLQDSYKQNFK